MILLYMFLLFLSSLIYSKEAKFHEPFGKDILLVIYYNHPYYSTTNFLKKLYSPYFPNIVFYSRTYDKNLGYFPHHDDWIYQYMLLAHVMEKYPQYKGYLYTNDDCVINPWNFTTFDKTKIWFIKAKKAELVPVSFKKGKPGIQGWGWWQGPYGYCSIKNAYEKLSEKHRTMLIKNCGPQTIFWGYSDVIYLPAHFKQDVTELCNLFEKSNVMLEIALPTLCGCLDEVKNWQIFHGLDLWEEDRNFGKERYTRNQDYVHPIKFSIKMNQDFIRNQFLIAFQKINLIDFHTLINKNILKTIDPITLSYQCLNNIELFQTNMITNIHHLSKLDFEPADNNTLFLVMNFYNNLSGLCNTL